MPTGDQGFRALPPSLDPRVATSSASPPGRSSASSPTLASSKARVALETLRTSIYQQSHQPTILTPRESVVSPNNTMGSLSSISAMDQRSFDNNAEIGRLSHLILQHQEHTDRLEAQKHDTEDQLSTYRIKYNECEASNVMLQEKISSLTQLMHEVRDDMVAVESKNQHLDAMNHTLMNEVQTLTQENERLKELHREELNQIDGVLKAVQESKNSELDHLRTELLEAMEYQQKHSDAESQLMALSDRYASMDAHQEELRACALAFQESADRYKIEMEFQEATKNSMRYINRSILNLGHTASIKLADSQRQLLGNEEQAQRQKLQSIHTTGLLSLTTARDDRVIGSTRSVTASKLLYLEHRSTLQKYLLRWITAAHQSHKQAKQQQLQQLSVKCVDFAASKEQLALLTTTNEELANKNKSLQISDAENQQKQRALQQDLEVLEAKNNVLTQQLESSNVKAKEAESSTLYAKCLEQKLADSDELKEALENGKQTIQKLTEQLQEGEQKWKTDLDAKSAQLTDQCSQLESSVSELQSANITATAKLRLLESLEQDHQTLIENNAVTIVENQALKGKVTNLENQLTSQQTRCDDLQQQLSDNVDMNGTIQSLTSQLSTSETQLAALRKQTHTTTDQLREAEQQLATLESSAIESNTTIRSLQAKLSATESQLSTLRDGDEKLTKAETIISSQKLDLDALRNEISSCEAQWALAKKEAVAARDRLQATEEKALAAESEGSEAKIKSQKLQQEVTELKITLDRTEREADGLRRENEVMRRQVAEVGRKNQRLEEDLSDTTRSVASLQKRCDAAEDVADDSSRSLSTMRDQLQTFEDDTYQLRKSRNEYKQICQQVQHDLDLDDEPLPTVLNQVNQYKQTCVQIQRVLGLESLRSESKSPTPSIDAFDTMSERSASPSIRWSRPPLNDLVSGVSSLQQLRTDLLRIFSLLGTPNVSNNDILTRAEYLSNTCSNLLVEMGVPDVVDDDTDSAHPLQSLIDTICIQRESCDKLMQLFGHTTEPESIGTVIEQVTTEHGLIQSLQKDLGLPLSGDLSNLRDTVVAQHALLSKVQKDHFGSKPFIDVAPALQDRLLKYKELYDCVRRHLPPEDSSDPQYGIEKAFRDQSELQAAITYLSDTVGATSTSELKQIVAAQQAVCDSLQGDKDSEPDKVDLLKKCQEQLFLIESLKMDVGAKSLSDLKRSTSACKTISDALSDGGGAATADITTAAEQVAEQQRLLSELRLKLNTGSDEELKEKILSQNKIISSLDNPDTTLSDQRSMNRIKSLLGVQTLPDAEQLIQKTVQLTGSSSGQNLLDIVEGQKEVIASLKDRFSLAAESTEPSDISSLSSKLVEETKAMNRLRELTGITEPGDSTLLSSLEETKRSMKAIQQELGATSEAEAISKIKKLCSLSSNIEDDTATVSRLLSESQPASSKEQPNLSTLLSSFEDCKQSMAAIQKELGVTTEADAIDQIIKLRTLVSDEDAAKINNMSESNQPNLSHLLKELEDSRTTINTLKGELGVTTEADAITQAAKLRLLVTEEDAATISQMSESQQPKLSDLLKELEDSRATTTTINKELGVASSAEALQQISKLQTVQHQLSADSPEQVLQAIDEMKKATGTDDTKNELPAKVSHQSDVLNKLRMLTGTDDNDELLSVVKSLKDSVFDGNNSSGLSDAITSTNKKTELLANLREALEVDTDGELLEKMSSLQSTARTLGNILDTTSPDQMISKVKSSTDIQSNLQQVLGTDTVTEMMSQFEEQTNVLTLLKETLSSNTAPEALEAAVELKKITDDLASILDEDYPGDALELVKDHHHFISNLKKTLGADTIDSLQTTIFEQQELSKQIKQIHGDKDHSSIIEEAQVSKEFTDELRKLVKTDDLQLLCDQYTILSELFDIYKVNPESAQDMSKLMQKITDDKQLRTDLEAALGATTPSSILEIIDGMKAAQGQNSKIQEIVTQETAFHSFHDDDDQPSGNLSEVITRSYRRIRQLEAELKGVNKIASENQADARFIGGSVSELVASLYSQIDTLKKQVSDSDAEIAKLQDMIERLEARFSALQVEAQGYCNEIATLTNEKIGGLHKMKIDENESLMANLQKEISGFNSRRSSAASLESGDVIHQSTTMLSFRMPTPLSGRVSLDSVFDGRTISLQDRLSEDILIQPPSVASSLSPADQKMIRDIEHEYMFKEAKYQAKISALELTVGALEEAPSSTGKRDAVIKRLESEVENYIAKIAILESKLEQYQKKTMKSAAAAVDEQTTFLQLDKTTPQIDFGNRPSDEKQLVSHLQAELEGVSSGSSSPEVSQIDLLRTRIAALQDVVAEKNAVISDLETDLQTTDGRIRALEHDIQERLLTTGPSDVDTVTEAELLIQLKERDAVIDSLHQRLVVHEGDDSSLSQQLAEKDAHITSLQNMLSERENTDHQNKLKIAQLEAELSTEPVTEIDDQRQRDIIKIATLDAMVESLKESHSTEVESLKQKISLLISQQNDQQPEPDADIDALRESNRNKVARIQTLESRLSETEELEAEFKDAREQLLTARQQRATLESENQSLAMFKEIVDSLTDLLQTAADQLLTKVRTLLNDQTTSQSSSTLDSLTTLLGTTTNEVVNKVKVLLSDRSELTSLENLLQVSTDKVVVKVQSLVDELQQQHNLNASVSTVMSTEEELSSKIKDMETEMDLLQEDKMTLRKLQNENDRYESMISSLESTCEDLRQELAQQKSEAAMFSNELQESNQKYANADEALRSLRGGALRADAATAAVRQQCDTLKAECNSLKEELTLLKNNNQIQLDEEYCLWSDTLGWETTGSPTGTLRTIEELQLIRQNVINRLTQTKPEAATYSEQEQIAHLKASAQQRLDDEIQFWKTSGLDISATDNISSIRASIRDTFTKLQQTAMSRDQQEFNYWAAVVNRPHLSTASVSHQDVNQIREEVRGHLSRSSPATNSQLTQLLSEENDLWSEVLGTQPLASSELSLDSVKTIRNRAVTLLTSDRAAEQLRDMMYDENNFWCSALGIPSGSTPTPETIHDLRQEVLSILIDKSQTLSNLLTEETSFWDDVLGNPPSASRPTIESVTALRARVAARLQEPSSLEHEQLFWLQTLQRSPNRSATSTSIKALRQEVADIVRNTPKDEYLLEDEFSFLNNALNKSPSEQPTPTAIAHLRQELFDRLQYDNKDELQEALNDEQKFWLQVLDRTTTDPATLQGVRYLRNEVLQKLNNESDTLKSVLTEEAELWRDILGASHAVIKSSQITPAGVKAMRDTAVATLAENTATLNSHLSDEFDFWNDILQQEDSPELITPTTVQSMRKKATAHLQQNSQTHHFKQELQYWSNITGIPVPATDTPTAADVQSARQHAVSLLKGDATKIGSETLRQEYHLYKQLDQHHNEEERSYWCELLNESTSDNPGSSREELQKLRERAVDFIRTSSTESDSIKDPTIPVSLINLLKTHWDAECSLLTQKCKAITQGIPQSPSDHNEMGATLQGNPHMMMLNNLKDKLCQLHQKYSTLCQESGPSPPRTQPVVGSSNTSGMYQFYRSRSVTPSIDEPILEPSSSSTVFGISNINRCCWGRMVQLDIGWWIADNTVLPDPQVQTDISDRFQKLLSISNEEDKSLILQPWDDDGCPDAVAGSDAPSTLATACQSLMDYSGLENPLQLISSILSSRHYFSHSPDLMSCNLSSVLLYQSKVVGATCDPNQTIYPSCTDIEIFILSLLTLTDEELKVLYGIDLQSGGGGGDKLCTSSSLRYHIAQVTRTCLHQDYENDEIMKWGSLGTLLFNILTHPDNDIPSTVYRTVKVSQNVAEDHLLVSSGSYYGWAAPIQCTSTAPSPDVLASSSTHSSSDVTISFVITNLQAGARVPHSQSDVLLPPFASFTIESVEEKSSKLIIVAMKWNGVPSMMGLGSRLDGMSLVEGLEMTARNGKESTSMRLPTSKLVSELEKQKSLRPTTAGGYDESLAAEHADLKKEVQKLRSDLTQESELCRELDDQRIALQNTLSSKPSRAPLAELIYTSWNKLEASRRSARDLKSTLHKLDKPRDLSILLGTVEDLHSKLKWATQSLLTPHELSSCKSTSAKDPPKLKIQPKPAEVKGRWK